MLGCVGLALLLASPDLARGQLELISSSLGAPTHGGNGRSDLTSISDDGRFIAFNGLATDLLPGGVDGNGLYDQFVRDRSTGTLGLVSVASTGSAAANRTSGAGKLSPGGRFVLFQSSASDLVPGYVDGNDPAAYDLFVRDRTQGTTALVNIDVTGTRSSNATAEPLQITDGGIAVFISGATDLVAGFVDGNHPVFDRDVFVRDMNAGTTTLVSVNAGGTASGNDDSGIPSISADGRLVVFVSQASDLIGEGRDANGASDVFVRDLSTGTTGLVSVNVSGTGSGNGASAGAVVGSFAMTRDGRYVAFVSQATDLVAGFVDGNGGVGGDLYLRDLATNTTSLISVARSGSESGDAGVGNGGKESFSMSPDGRFIVFTSHAANLVDGVVDANGAKADVFVRDRLNGTTSLVSAAHDAPTMTGNASSSVGSFTAISADGRFVLFLSAATDLVPGFVRANGQFGEDLFLRDMAMGTTTLVSAAADGMSGANTSIAAAAMSVDGQVIAFSSNASNLLPPAQGGKGDVYVFRNEAPEVTPTSLPPSATPTATPVVPPPVGDCSGDGRVTVDDLVKSVNIALGKVLVTACPAADPNHDGRVTIDELIRAVKVALSG